MIITIARKPLEGTVVNNCLNHKCGSLNIDTTRIPLTEECKPDHVQRQQNSGGSITGAFGASALIGTAIPTFNSKGRWPANTVLASKESSFLQAFQAGKEDYSRYFKTIEGGKE